MSNAKLWCFRCFRLEIPGTNSQVAGGLRHHYTHVTSMRCHSVDLITWCWVGEYMHHLSKRHMMECRQPQYAPITINLCVWHDLKLYHSFFRNSDAVRGWQQNSRQPSLRPLWELPQKRWFSCCECPRLNSAHVDKNTPEEYSKASMCCR